MKKVLKKSLRRLHTLLLLAVMFVVGGSAWAETVTFTSFSGSTTNQGPITVSDYYSESNKIVLYSGATSFSISASNGYAITKVVLGGEQISTYMNTSDGTKETANAKSGTWNFNNKESLTFGGSFPMRWDFAEINEITVTYQSSAPSGPVDWTVEYSGTNGSVTYDGNYPTDGKFAIEGDPEDELVEVGDVFGYTSSFRFDEANHKLIVTYTAVQNYELPVGISIAHGNGNPVITAAQVGLTGFAANAHQIHFNAQWYKSGMSYGETNTANNLYFTVSQDGSTATLHGFESILNNQENYGIISLLLPEGALVDKNGAKNDAVEYGYSNNITIQNGGSYSVYVYDNDNNNNAEKLPANWSITVNGQNITAVSGITIKSQSPLTISDVVVADVAGYIYEKGITSSSVSVKYIKQYTISVTGLPGGETGGIRYTGSGDYFYNNVAGAGQTYNNGDIFARKNGFLTDAAMADFSGVRVNNYRCEVRLDGSTVVVAYAPLNISANAADSNGDCWTSFCNDYPFTLEDGYTAYIVKDNGNGGIKLEALEGTVPAGAGVLVKGVAKNGIQFTANNNNIADTTGNLLRGCSQSETWEDNDKLFYRLTWASDEYDDFGFYWDAEGGHSVRAKAGKAYLVLDANDANQSASRILIFNNDDDITAIDAVKNVADDTPIYNLQGKRVARESLTSGVYVQNGKKFIVK